LFEHDLNNPGAGYGAGEKTQSSAEVLVSVGHQARVAFSQHIFQRELLQGIQLIDKIGLDSISREL
jgi:hypothetical protein